MNTKHFLRLTVAGLFVVVLAVAIVFPALAAHHDCEGDGCPVCLAVIVCRYSLSFGAAPQAENLYSEFTDTHSLVMNFDRLSSSRSDLVALAVKLSR